MGSPPSLLLALCLRACAAGSSPPPPEPPPPRALASLDASNFTFVLSHAAPISLVLFAAPMCGRSDELRPPLKVAASLLAPRPPAERPAVYVCEDAALAEAAAAHIFPAVRLYRGSANAPERLRVMPGVKE